MVPCKACARHIRELETTCPFCRSAAAPSVSVAGGRLPRLAGIGHASRAVLLAVEALAQVACRSTSTQSGEGRELSAEVTATQHETAQGKRDNPDTSSTEDEYTDNQRMNKIAVYGAPPAPSELLEAIERLERPKGKSLRAKCSTDDPSCTNRQRR